MIPGKGDEKVFSTADAVARRSYGKLVAFLAARTHDIAAAEDALSDAFAAALEDWPANGTPANPEAWLLTVARRKLIDASRRSATAEAASPELQLIAEHAQREALTSPRRRFHSRLRRISRAARSKCRRKARRTRARTKFPTAASRSCSP